MNEDTLHLLSECAAGTDMAIRSLDDVLKNSPDGPLQTADLISTGCSMGIKSLARYCNQYPTASREAKDIAQSLIRLEDQLVKDMRPYL